jgi:40S ribosomal S4-like protein/KOW motif-containing protein
VKVNDTVKIELATGKITDFIKFDTGAIAMVTGGRNMGRVGTITHRERHDGGFNIVHIKDVVDNEFATRESNVFIIGKEKPWISLPKGKGVKVRKCQMASGNSVVLMRINSSLLPKSVIVDEQINQLVGKCSKRKHGDMPVGRHCKTNIWSISALGVGVAWENQLPIIAKSS